MNDSGPPDSGARMPTHRALTPSEMARLGPLLEQAASGGVISHAAIEQLARANDIDASALYAAAAMTTTLELAREHRVAFTVCAGACQGFGALECLQTLVELRNQRHKRWFKKAFDIQTKSCLSGCDHAPMVRVHTKDGIGYIQRATPEHLAEAVKAVCG